MRKILICLTAYFLTIGILMVDGTYAQANASCFAPGNRVVSDASGDAVLAQNDIESVSIAEPFYSDNSQKLIFTMKVNNLYSLPLTSYNIFFKGPDNVERFVQMNTLLGTTEFRYGTLTNLLGIPIFNYAGSVYGTYETDGTITFIINKSAVGNFAVGSVISVSAHAYVKPAIDLVEVDSTGTNGYTVVGNGSCTPYKIKSWGQNGDIPVSRNYFRNEVNDFAVWRPSTGIWYATDALTDASMGFAFGSGAAGDIPVPGNYDRDSKADFAVYRPSTGSWYIQKSENNSFQAVRFGAAEDIPVVGDFDGDRIDDITVYRPSTGSWYTLFSKDASVRGVAFGAGTDTVVPADYDGDGKTDIAVWRPENGAWYVLRSSDGTYSGYAWGAGTDRVQPGDYNGNGRADYGVWRPENGVWYVYLN